MVRTSTKKISLLERIKIDIRKHWILYVMLMPVVIYFIIFEYYPVYGLTLAFKKYNAKLGIGGSPWVGFKHFARLFKLHSFPTMIRNTLEMSLYSLVVGFPIPIVFALMLNYVENKKLKKTVQMVSYAPHFLSTVVVCSMITMFCSKDGGVFNVFRNLIGMESVSFLSVPEWFKDIYTWSGVWQGMGWSAIIYISALAGVDPTLHEAAIVDGATKIQRMWHVDIPSIKSTIVMLLIMRMGSIMSVGFEKVYLLRNSLNLEAAQVISTYVYQLGLLNGQMSYSAAIGLFNTVVNVLLLLFVNTIVKKLSEISLF